MYEHIVFDIDGTLLNTEYCIIRALQDTLLERTGKQIAAAIHAEFQSARRLP